MGDKLYPNSSVYNIYNRAPCAKQTTYDNSQQYYTYNTYPQSNNMLDTFNVVPPQTCPKTPNMCMYSGQVDMTWEDSLKISDKIDTIEISSKDLSPASYCSNLDMYMPEIYKSLSNSSQWYPQNNYNTNQKVSEFPSCAQSTQTANKYCSIQQKSQDCYNYNDLIFNDQNFYTNKTITGKGVEDFNSIYNSYFEASKVQDSLSNHFFDLPETFQPIDQQTEGSNEESDIVVEDSEEEITEYGDKRIPSGTSRCLICNKLYTPLGSQFYYLSSKSPLTMSSQKSVFKRIISIVGRIMNKINYLCSECLGLINTIDHLQLKLESFNSELLTKFRQTCRDNNIKNFGRRQKLRSRSDRKVRCKFCKKILSLKKVCENHLRRHKFRGYLCELCGETFRDRLRFKLHQLSHKPKVHKIPSFKCSSCPKNFRTKSNLVEHENYCLGLLPYGCKFCDKRFASSTKLKNHVKLKHDKKFVAICSICNIGFVTLSDYKSHKISHSTDKKFSCTKCDKSYKTVSNLNFHMKVHNNKLPFICEICSRGFMRKEYLEAHVNNHNGIKNFGCGICDKKFVSQKNLDSHMKYHDGSAKSRTCNICGKTMISGFEEHLRIHNNLEEFECELCECRFNTKGTLAKHKKRKHAQAS